MKNWLMSRVVSKGNDTRCRGKNRRNGSKERGNRKRRLEEDDEPDNPFDCIDEELEELLQGIWNHME